MIGRRPASLGFELTLAVVLGALHSVAFATTRLWWLQLIVCGALAFRVASRPPGRAAAMGLAFGTAWLASSTWWLFVSLHTYGGLPAWMAVLAVLGLSAFLSLYLTAALTAFARWRTGHSLLDAMLFGAVWLLAELARGVLFTGFPWAASGYAHIEGPLAVLAPWLGVYGIGFVATVLAAWIGLALSRLRDGSGFAPMRPLGGALGGAFAVLLVLAAAGPARFTQASGRLTVSLIQSNVPQNEKFLPQLVPEMLAAAAEQLLGARGQLVVAPETVIPVLPDEVDPAYWQALTQHFTRGPQAALIGMPLGNEDVGYTNSAAGLSAATASLPGGFYRYNKHHLVPFGEFVPTGFHWFTELMNIPLGDFNRGPVAPASFWFKGQRIGANICYEDLFGEELAARFGDASSAPTLFANISNIGWFGDTIAIDQHLQISRMRTLELQRPMVRATNTGATAVIDHEGQVTASLPRYTRGVLDAEVEGRVGVTPFAFWASRFGLWPPLVIALLIVAGVAVGGRRGEGRVRPPGRRDRGNPTSRILVSR